MKITKRKKKVLIDSLPKDWKQKAATESGMSQSYVEKVLYGVKNDLSVLDIIIRIAAENKEDMIQKAKQISERLENLTN